jgi:hypothetical protein
MKNKALIRFVVFAAIFAWPAVESYRYYAARQQLAASEELHSSVSAQVAQVRAKHSPVTRTVQANSRDAR